MGASVDFATYCCKKDINKLHDNFSDHVKSHGYEFDNIHLIYQRCLPDVGRLLLNMLPGVYKHFIEDTSYPTILLRNCINPDNKEADEYTHGWDHSHYWRHHVVNHLVALEQSTADYIVLSDADCYIKSQPNGQSWVTAGIEVLKANKSILVVSPGDGSGSKHFKTQNMSQQMFLCERERLKNIDFDLPFTGFKDGGPMQEYYFMLEGRIGRYMEKNNLYRHILGDRFRYWHLQWH